MLTKLGLENFKVFEKEQSLKLGKKFTLIYGSNSSGKSSLFQGIQIIKESLNSPDSGFKYLGIQGEMNDFINKNNKSKDKIMSLAFEAEAIFPSRIRSFSPGSGLGDVTRILNNYGGVIYPIKFGIDIKIKLEKDDAKIEKIKFKLKFQYDDNSNDSSERRILAYDSQDKSTKKILKTKNLKEKEILVLELEALDKIKKNNLKKYFPNYTGKYDKSYNSLSVFKLNDITNEDKIWKYWWVVKNRYLKSYEREKVNLFRDSDEDKKRIKFYENKIEKIKAKDYKNKKTLEGSIDNVLKNLKNDRFEIRELQKKIKYLQTRQPRDNFRVREFERAHPSKVIQELKKLNTYNKFKSKMINDLKNNLKFTSLNLDFSKNISKFSDLSYGYRTRNPIGNSLFEKFSNALQFGRLYFRERMNLPLINLTTLPEAFLSNLNRTVFKNIFTVHSTESEFSDSYRMRQDNYDTVGRDGKNTPYILIKNKKTLSSVNKTLKEVMNIELSLSKGKLQGENHFIFKAKDSLSGKSTDTIKMKLAGKGFNSIIPYLTEIMMHEKSMILLEEIENSLHPKIISPLIDSLTSFENGNRYVLETHSKHIVLKMQQMVKNKKLDKEDIAINYVERKKEGSKINHIPLDENGDFTVSWPEGGFFPEESKIILG